ncbi:hypothetical protein ACGFYZ_31350 [Streptomyces sp. NPDC048330]|uniref:hypothetical protein n=1 Tax=Streptomyces sp. NPDC048330 TaxID=3365533 RepID=UPI003723DB28
MRGRGTWAAVLAVVAVASATGCGQEERPAKAAPEVRRDEAPITSRVPQLGDVESVEWTYEPLGVADERVPGPTDRELRGFARLTEGDVRRLVEEYTWVDASAAPSATPSGSAAGTRWRSSRGFDAAAGKKAEAAEFRLDTAGRVMTFRLLNPS